MTLEEIHARLTEKFGEAIEPFSQPENGDAWIEVRAENWLEVAAALKDDQDLAFDLLRCVSGVDYVDWMESVYHLLSFKHEHEVVIKVKVDRASPRVASVSGIWAAAEWHECESYDMVGIVYEEHPDLRRILLPEDWEGFPLRKDYKQPDEYHGISHW